LLEFNGADGGESNPRPTASEAVALIH